MAQDAVGGPSAVQPSKMMPADAHPSFEVAAIKASDPNNPSDRIHTDGRHVLLENQSVDKLIQFAYGLQRSQLAGGPAWADTDRYDVNGVTDVVGEPNTKQLQGMVQRLLVERFGLAFHREQRELPVYAITVAKGGAKLTRSASDPNGPMDESGSGSGTALSMKFTNTSMADFGMIMQFVVDRPMVDRTGMAGRYDFVLRYTYDEARATDPNAPPGLFTAIQEQLGLKLEPVKAPTEVLVVDTVERPSEN
ncbi:MAG: TIGR03435 family protein [Acidobacteriaceae bacterium]|jgi:uncharacterized protein (TIGR03435 family)